MGLVRRRDVVSGALKLANAAPGGLSAATERGGRVWSVTEREIDVKRESDLITFLNSEAAAAQIDWSVTPQANRRKKLLISDMDSTIIGQECIDELADYVGLKEKVARITERAMQGELDFPGALRERVRLLAGLDERALKRCLNERVEVTAGAEALVQTMRAGGSSCLLVSGGFLSFAEPIAGAVGFDRVKANRLVFTGGKLSGEVGDPIIDAMAKHDALVEAREQLGLRREDVLAVGDGANDKLMIEEAGLGIAFRAKPALVEVADAELRSHGLDALLWVQGVRRRDWFRA